MQHTWRVYSPCMRDLRQQKRHSFAKPLLMKSGSRTFKADTVDISQNGARMVGSLPELQEGTAVQLVFQIGAKEFHTVEAVAVRGQVGQELCVKFERLFDTGLIGLAA
ncbi:MAG TPA: PilZ domain-containing protein [Phycisphaerales bacterium]|nr:PilZ domain-containing protein [Phycisphaerales bacterium]